MIEEVFTFASADKKTQIHAVKWLPDTSEYKAILQITHGMIEYIERYKGFAQFMTENGYMVVGHDHLGHGQSVNSEADLGFFKEDNPSDVLVEDMHTLRTTIQKDNPNVAYFMFGHSMGSYLLRKYLTLHDDNLRGAIIAGTGFMPQKTCISGLKFIALIARFRGERYRSNLVKKLTFSKSYKKFDMTGKEPAKSWLTTDEEIVKKYYSDPLCTYDFTLNGYRGLIETVLYDCTPENVAKMSKKLPLFIISGQDDPVGDLGEGVMKTYDMYMNAGCFDVTYKLYEGMRHELLNETNKQKVYSDILSWSNVRIET